MDDLSEMPFRTAETAIRSVMLVDDDASYRRMTSVALERRGFTIEAVDSLAEARRIAPMFRPDAAILETRLADGNGLDLASMLLAIRSDMRIIYLTSYASVATAVAAVKAGASDYLAKPADADMIERALSAKDGDRPEPPESPMSADRVRWEHIQRIFEQCDRNVSETARRLRMHRRTLQRILSKHAPRA